MKAKLSCFVPIILFLMVVLAAELFPSLALETAGRNNLPRPRQESTMDRHSSLLIDDFARDDRVSAMGTSWRMFTDQVMGGISTAALRFESVAGRRALRLTGDVSLENNGGFVQAALPLAANGAPMDVSSYLGIRLLVSGNGETYHVHLRTAETRLPWQYYHASFSAGTSWKTVELPFSAFRGAALQIGLNASQVTRIAVVASGKDFRADIAVGRVEFYR